MKFNYSQTNDGGYYEAAEKGISYLNNLLKIANYLLNDVSGATKEELHKTFLRLISSNQEMGKFLNKQKFKLDTRIN
jgi:hypothetical protein